MKINEKHTWTWCSVALKIRRWSAMIKTLEQKTNVERTWKEIDLYPAAVCAHVNVRWKQRTGLFVPWSTKNQSMELIVITKENRFTFFKQAVNCKNSSIILEERDSYAWIRKPIFAILTAVEMTSTRKEFPSCFVKGNFTLRKSNTAAFPWRNRFIRRLSSNTLWIFLDS